MAFLPNFKSSETSQLRSNLSGNSGIALFMVIAAVALLSMIVVQLSYVVQVNQAISYGAMDQAKAHYLAKAGFKLSLLRLKAYQQAKQIIQNMGAAGGAVPKSMIEKVWSFPFFYPLPTTIPGISIGEKAAIEKFQKDSNLEGSYSALIESESSKFDLNSIVPGMSVRPSPNPTSSPQQDGAAGFGTNGNTPLVPTPLPSFSAEDGRESLGDFFSTILDQKFREDPDFAASYRDVRIPDIIDNIASWSDRSYQRRTANRDKLQLKQAPFYSLSELHFLGTLDDELYNLFAPNLTTVPNSGLNVNTVKEPTLRALVPGMTRDDIAEFIKYRDSETSDHLFSSADAFFKYLNTKVAFYRDSTNLEQLKQDLAKRNIQVITDETNFKITIQAKVNSATRTLIAWVALVPTTGGIRTQGQTGGNSGGQLSNNVTGRGIQPRGAEAGIKVLYMTIQ